MKNFPFENFIYINCDNSKFFKYKKFYMILKDEESEMNKYNLANDMPYIIRDHIYITILDCILDKFDGEVMELEKKGMFVYINKLYGKKIHHFRHFIVDLTNEIISMIKNKEYRIYNNDHIVTKNNYLINVKNKYIRKIEKDEHVYNSLNMNLYMDFNNVKDVFIGKNLYAKEVLKTTSLLNGFLTNDGVVEYINLIKHIIMGENDIGIIISKSVPHMLLYDFLTYFFGDIINTNINVFPNEDSKKISIIGGRYLYITDDENDKILPDVFTKIHISNPGTIQYTPFPCIYCISFIILLTGNSDILFSKAMENYVSMQHASDIFALIVKKSL